MANYYSNHLIIRGERHELRRFACVVLPRQSEESQDSVAGHGDGPLSFSILQTSPVELQGDAVREQGTMYEWRMKNWECRFPQDCKCSVTDDCLEYWFDTRCSHACYFVENVSDLYPKLAFRLVWWDVYSGEHGTPVKYALLAMQAGRICCEYDEMSGTVLSATLAELDGVPMTFPDRFCEPEPESTTDPTVRPDSFTPPEGQERGDETDLPF